MIRFTTLAFLTFVFTSGAATAQISPPADPFEKYFDRIEERLAAQTAVMERIGAVLERFEVAIPTLDEVFVRVVGAG